MEHKLRKESIEWFENSKRSVTLLKDYFDDRLLLEEQVESMYATFHNKWQKKFQNHEDPMKMSSKQSLADMTRFMVEELGDNSDICCSLKSLLQRKHQSPSSILNNDTFFRWLNDPMENTTCIDVQEFRDCYISNVASMAEHEKEANKSLQTLHEKLAALQQVVEEWERLPHSAINRSIQLARMEDEGEIEVEKAKDSYQQAVCLHREAQQPYVQTMNYLRECLESFETNRLATMQKATRLYLNAINQYETQRQRRKERVEQLVEYFDSMPVSKSVQNWITSIQEPYSFPFYLEAHQVLAVSHQILSDDGSRDARTADDLSSELEIDLEVTSEELTEEVTQGGKSVNIDKMFKSGIENSNVTVRIPVEPDLETFCQMSMSLPGTALKSEGQISPEIWATDAAWDVPSESQMAIESVESKEFAEEVTQDGRSINTKKWFRSSLKQIDVDKIPVKPGQAFEIKTTKTESITSEASDVTAVSRAAHVKVCALESYTSLLPGHLSFHTGQKIKQKRAANEEGLAYGYIVNNKFLRRRTYGLYPVRLVALKVPSKKRRFIDFFRKK